MSAEFPQEELDNLVFTAKELLGSLDYVQELKILQVPVYNITRKRELTKDFKALYIALWHFALERPFKENTNIIYEHFLKSEWAWEKKSQNEIINRAEQYYEKLHERGKEDFTEIAKHLLSYGVFDEETLRKNVLKLALLIRSRYTFLFENLN